jgi:hypothetical protein
VARTNAVLEIYENNLTEPFLVMPSYGDGISCCCVNHLFFVAIIGTRDGSLILNSLNKGTIVRVVDLGGAVPHLILVTNGWGFIVVYAQELNGGNSEEFICVFSVNGELLKKRKIDFEVVAWTTWTTMDGFDYIALADDNGKLFAFEVFYCDLGESLFRCRSPIIGLNYVRGLSCLVVVTKDNRILFIPHCVS